MAYNFRDIFFLSIFIVKNNLITAYNFSCCKFIDQFKGRIQRIFPILPMHDLAGLLLGGTHFSVVDKWQLDKRKNPTTTIPVKRNEDKMLVQSPWSRVPRVRITIYLLYILQREKTKTTKNLIPSTATWQMQGSPRREIKNCLW